MGNCSTNTTNFVNNVNEPVKDEEEEIFDANAEQNGSVAICLQNDEQKIDTHDIKDEENVVCEEEIVNSLKNNEDNLLESKFNVDFLRKRRKVYWIEWNTKNLLAFENISWNQHRRKELEKISSNQLTYDLLVKTLC